MIRKVFTLAAALLLCLVCVCAAQASETILAEGAKGSGVRCLQEELKTLGYFTVEPDGVYGMNTGMAVAEYARAKGLDIAQGVDIDFIRALREDLSVGTIDKGDSGTSVYAIQKILYTMGFIESQPDGKFGDQTKQGVKQYMTIVAESAAAYMQELEDAKAAEILANQPADMPVAYDAPLITAQTVVTDGSVTEAWFEFIMDSSVRYGADIGKDSDKNSVRRVQRRLKVLKYTADTRIDGVYGANTARVVKYFQKLNGLQETGTCDQATQQILFSDKAIVSDQYVAPYMARVDTSASRVYIYEWTGSGYTDKVKTFVCSCGKKATPTAKGTYQAVGQISPWYYMPNSSVWVRNAFQIEGNYFFHSVLFHSKGSKTPTASSVRNLGSNVSHGCIRLSVEDSGWIYEHCTPGMTVVIE